MEIRIPVWAYVHVSSIHVFQKGKHMYSSILINKYTETHLYIIIYTYLCMRVCLTNSKWSSSNPQKRHCPSLGHCGPPQTWYKLCSRHIGNESRYKPNGNPLWKSPLNDQYKMGLTSFCFAKQTNFTGILLSGKAPCSLKRPKIAPNHC